jgi:putative nucleotidyltransferase with HDIG domain
MASAQEIRSQARRLEEVPTLPTFFNKIVETIADNRSRAKDLAEIISKDQSLSAKILRLANSAYYGRFREVSTLEQAVTIVGFNEIKSVSLSVAVFGSFSLQLPLQTLESFWIHALSCAAAIKAIGDRGQELSVEKIYFGGLLHDIGKLALNLMFGRDYLSIMEVAAREGCGVDEIEERTYGVHHAQVGEWLAERWHFPSDLIESIAYHHQPLRADLVGPKVVATVYLANWIAKQPAIGEDTIAPVDPLRMEVLDLLELQEAEALQICREVAEEQAKTREMLSVIS